MTAIKQKIADSHHQNKREDKTLTLTIYIF